MGGDGGKNHKTNKKNPTYKRQAKQETAITWNGTGSKWME